MCWNLSVSLSFSVLYVASIAFYYLKKPRYWNLYVLFCSFYLIMELFQSSQWLFGDVVPSYEVFGPKSCSLRNKSFTHVAYMLIWLQPLLFSIIGYLQNRDNIFKKIIVFNLIVFCLSLIGIAGLYHKQKYIIENSNFSSNTCTDVGLSNHLSWRFSVGNIDYAFNNMTYLILCIFPFLFYKEELKNIWKGWVATLLLTKLILNPYDTEVPSTWCLVSIFANIIVMLGANYN